MPIVYIPNMLRELTEGVERVEVEGATLRQVIAALEARFPSLVGRLREGDTITPGLGVSIDGAFSSRGLLAKVGPNSEVHFLPAIGGG